MTTLTAKARYSQLQGSRSAFVSRAQDHARHTIPSLFSNTNAVYTGRKAGAGRLAEPYQSVGAEAVTHLSSRLLIALLPPGRNFFRLDIPSDLIAKAATDRQVKDKLTEYRRVLAAYEAAAQASVNASNWRVTTDASLQQLIVAGNVLEHIAADNTLKLYRLDQYCVERDYWGVVQEIVIEDRMGVSSLPPEARSLVPTTKDEEDVALYTWIKRSRDGREYEVAQYIEEHEVPTSRGSWPADELPYSALRWKTIPGEHYGRSKVEEHIADLRALEGAEKSLLEGAAMAARNVIMIKPMASGAMLQNKVAGAINGDVIVGDWDQVKFLSFENHVGMQLTAQFAEKVERRLRYAFLLSKAVQRDAERVTATEINVLVEDIENVLGGVYSSLAHEMMDWRLGRLLANLQETKTLPKWTKGDVVPVVLTGLEALTRDRDVTRVRTAAEIINMFGEQALQAIDVQELLRQAFIGLGLHDVTLSKEEVEASQQQQMQSEQLMKGLGQAIPAMARQEG